MEQLKDLLKLRKCKCCRHEHFMPEDICLVCINVCPKYNSCHCSIYSNKDIQSGNLMKEENGLF